MNDRLTAFLDILGFKEEVKSADDRRLDALVALLRDITSSEVISGEDRVLQLGARDGQNVIKVLPRVTVFSDNIAVSYLKSDLAKKFPGNEMTYGVIFLEQRIRKFAADAGRLGLLIRGGITVGQLEHGSDGVVVGRAMIDAYLLESEVANYPRIVVSRDVYSAVKAPQGMLLRDQDGIVHFNYFEPMIDIYALGEKGDTFDEQRRTAQDKLLHTAGRKIAEYRIQEKDLRKVAKWTWFKKYLELARSGELPYY
jgi:hypothetical protein